MNRKLTIPIRVTEEEKAVIEENAAGVGMPVSRFLRNVGQAYEPASKLDKLNVAKLLQVNADQARYGNLLRLWLRSEEKSKELPEDFDIVACIEDIEAYRERLKEVIRQL